MPDDPLSAHLAFVGIDDRVRSSLRELRPLIRRTMPCILDDFYAHIVRYPEAAKLFPDPASTQRAKQMHIRHWDVIAAAEFDDAYIASVKKVGETHHRLGLPARWYIGGYIYLIAALCREIGLQGDNGWLARKSAARRAATMQRTAALIKAALFDMELALAVYFDAAARAKEALLDKLVDASFQRTVGLVSEASARLESTAHALVRTASCAKDIAGAVTRSFEDVSSSVNSIASAGDELAGSSEEISRQLADAGRIMRVAVQQVEKTDACISTLAQAAGQIGAVVKLITEIAEQTNLLALNAAIEAARAGAAGRGFSIVAQEVKALATQTANATGEITMQIGQIYDATRESIAATKDVLGTVRRASEISETISASLERQNAATQGIFRSIGNIAADVSAVAANIEKLTTGATETGSASDQLLTAARGLASENRRLETEVKNLLAAVHVGKP